MANRNRYAARGAETTDPAFDVALSFAGEDRRYVEKTANVLKQMGLRVFYDKYEQVSLWGKNLYDRLSQIYGKTSRYTVMFISRHYAQRLWTNLERQSAQAKAFLERSEYILPVRFDETEIPGIHATIGYIDLKTVSPRKLAELIKEKLGPLVRDNFMPDDPDRLLTAYGAKTVEEKRLLTRVARGVFEHLSLMTPEERQLVSVLALNTCPTGPEIDGDVHMNINLLARLTGVAVDEIIAVCSRIECLGFSYKLTTHGQRSQPKDILRLTYQPLYVAKELRGNWMRLVYAVFHCIAEHLCPVCLSTAINRMDLSVLSTRACLPDAHMQLNTSAQCSSGSRRDRASKEKYMRGATSRLKKI
jgi:TIR domain